MSKATVTITSDNRLRIESDYDQQFVEDLKAAIPHTEREWLPDAHLWYVDGRHAGKVRELVKEHYTDAWWVEGSRMTDLHTGRVNEQLTFGGLS